MKSGLRPFFVSSSSVKSKFKSLQQLMSLDIPKVILVPLNSDHSKMSLSLNNKLYKTVTKSTIVSSSSSSCRICANNKQHVSSNDQVSFITPHHRAYVQSLLGEEEDGFSWVFCSACLSTLTRLIRLSEEVEDIRVRIKAVLRMRDESMETSIHSSGFLDGVDQDDSMVKREEDGENDIKGFESDDGSLANDLWLSGIQGNEGISTTDLLLESDDTVMEDSSSLSSSSSNYHKSSRKHVIITIPCYFCHKTYQSPADLRAHLSKLHTMERPLLSPFVRDAPPFKTTKGCPLCKIYFKSEATFLSHTHPDPTNDPTQVTYICPCNNKSYSTLKSFYAHRHKVHSLKNQGPFPCPSWGKVMESKPKFQRHIQTCHSHQENRTGFQKALLCCFFCRKTFKSPSTAQTHMRSHTQERPYFCVKCDSPSNRQLERHTDTDCCKTGKVKAAGHQCHICGQVLSTAGGVTSHIKMRHQEHTKVGPLSDHSCPQCRKTYNNRSQLISHMKLTHGLTPVQKVSCPICKEKFKNEKNLQVHTHPDPNDPERVSYVCPTCSRGHPTLKGLRTHVRQKHEIQVSSQCQCCGRIFKSVPGLQQHRKFCTAQTNALKCGKCGQVCASISERIDHVRVEHRGLSSTKCAICLKVFMQLSHLKRHVRRAHSSGNV